MINLYHIDCMDFMADKPDNYYELAIVDPPYGIGYDLMQKSNAEKNRISNSGKWKKYHNSNWDKEVPSKEYFTELFRVSNNQIIWGGNYFELSVTKCWLMWDKIQRDNRADCEMAWTSFKLPTKIFRYSRTDAYINDIEPVEKIHPTQKPIKLYKWLLHNYAKQGDKILDTHLGSMSIAIACHDLGFDLDGCEIDKEYYDAGVKRFNQHKQQLTIQFNPSE